MNSFQSAHLKSLWVICFPLMLSALSSTLMIFLDRIILAQYETHAMVAATAASNVFFVFQFGAMSIAMISEVFVGQFNGAKQYHHVSKPVWQMIWFVLLCGTFMIPIGIWGGKFFLPAEFMHDGGPYFKWIMIFGPCFPLVAALSSFFIGRGKVKIVTISVILGNIINFVLVMAFVFGIPGIMEPLGSKGAAIATGIAEMLVAIGLFSIFLNARNRKLYHSHRWHFNKDLFVQCIKIGLPNAIGHMTASAGWAFVMYLLANRSVEHVTVLSIGLSIWMLFSFITEGLQKGVTAVVSNCIGAKKNEQISAVLRTGLQLQFLLAMVLAIPLVIMPGILVNFFIPADSSASPHLRELVEHSCRWLWVAYLFDGMAWVIDGILTAAGDTRFIMLMNSVGTWLFCIAPIYFFVVKMEGNPIATLQWITLFCLILFTSYFLRYKSKKWKNNILAFQMA